MLRKVPLASESLLVMTMRAIRATSTRGPSKAMPLVMKMRAMRATSTRGPSKAMSLVMTMRATQATLTSEFLVALLTPNSHGIK